MKIGILTFWWSKDNYGQLLQCYALQKYLKDLGHSPFLIRYNPQKDTISSPFFFKIIKALNPIKLSRFLSKKIKSKCTKTEQLKNNRHFSDFRNKYIASSDRPYDSFAQLKANPPEADVYITGSDQVWNFYHLPIKKSISKIHAYFLDFGNAATKRASYAASWGTSFIEDEYIKEITPLLKQFNYVSVREESGIKLCKECGVSDVDWVPDPTMLLSPEIYRNLYLENPLRKQTQKYVLLYMLNNKCNFNIPKFFQWAKEKKLKVIYITGNGVIDKHKKFYATIPEWLYLIDNAEYVVTNSFHCCVFSILMKKQFAAIKLTGVHAEMNIRLESLFARSHIASRFISDDNYSALDVAY